MKSLIPKYSPSIRLAGFYLLFGIAWILLSDEVVYKISQQDSRTIEKLQNAKGLLFVCSSALLIYLISSKIYKNLSKAHNRQAELNQKLLALTKATREGIVDFDFNSDTAQINEEMKSMMGSDASVVKNFTDLNRRRIHPDDKKRVLENFRLFKLSSDTIFQAEYRYCVTDGSYKDVICRGYLIRDEKTGQPVNFIFALQDVTEIRDAKAKFYEQRIQFRQSLSKSIIEAQEKEKNRWAEELHDNVCQLLTAAKLFLEHALTSQNRNNAIEKSSTMIVTALNDIRQISSSIKPPEFSNTTLRASILDLIENLKRFKNFEFELQSKPEAESYLNNEQKLMIYRVVQEQLNNITKYAEAKKVWVTIDIEDDFALLKIKDDGKGFNPENVKAGIGLKNIKSRLQAFYGNLNIHSAPGKGCELEASFTLNY